MTIARNGTPGHLSQTAASTAVNITTTAPALICAAIFYNSTGPISSITDNSGVTAAWSSSNSVRATNGIASTTELWWTTASAAITAKTITVTLPAATFTTMDVFAYTGVNTSVLDVSAIETNATDPIPITTTVNADMLVACFSMSSTASPTAGSSWGAISGADFALVEDQLSTTAGSYSASITTGHNDTNVGLVVAFKQAVGGGARTPTLTMMGVGFDSLKDRTSGLFKPVRELWKPEKPKLWVPGFTI